MKGHLTVVHCLAEHGLDQDKADKLGYSPLHVAALGGHLNVAMYLAELISKPPAYQAGHL